MSNFLSLTFEIHLALNDCCEEFDGQNHALRLWCFRFLLHLSLLSGTDLISLVFLIVLLIFECLECFFKPLTIRSCVHVEVTATQVIS